MGRFHARRFAWLLVSLLLLSFGARPGRADFDNIEVGAAALIAPVCGDGNAESGEECDLGANNGSPSSCCTSACKFRPLGEVCRAAVTSCDKAETCSGASSGCAADGNQEDGFACGPELTCSKSVCTAGFCFQVAKSGPCDDGFFCTTDDRCSAGQCEPGEPVPCPRGTVCDEAIDACRDLPVMSLDVGQIRPVQRGATLRYHVVIQNFATAPASINWFDELPPAVAYVPGSLDSASGTTDDGNAAVLRWTGIIPARNSVTIDFDVVVRPEASCPDVIDNSAVALLPEGAGTQADARVQVLCSPADPTSACAGDCGGDDLVTVEELVLAVNDHLANPVVAACNAADTDRSASVSLPEVITGVETALGACQFSFAGLAGSWTGPVYQRNTLPVLAGQQTLTLHANGTVDGILGSLSAQLSTLDRSHHIIAFRRSDGVAGALQFSADGRHAVYVDELSVVGALERGATGLAPSYATSDLGYSYWFGSVARYGGGFTNDEASPFWGLTDPSGRFGLVSSGPNLRTGATPLDLSPNQDLAAIGTFEGDWQSSPAGSSGAAVFSMSPDKNFLAAQTCEGPFPLCDISAWSRVVLPQSASCDSCLIDTPPPTLRCLCLRADQQKYSSSSLTLPCLGSIEVDDGILTCR